MGTIYYDIWQQTLSTQDEVLSWLAGLGVFFVVCYLLTYVPWLPPSWGRLLRMSYEVGGGLLFVGILILSVYTL